MDDQPLSFARSPMRTWMSQSRVAHHFPPWSLRSTGFSSPVPLEHRAEGRAFSSLVLQEHWVKGWASFSPLYPRSTGSRAAHTPLRFPRSIETRAAPLFPPRSLRSIGWSRTSHSSLIGPFSSPIAPFSSPIARFSSPIAPFFSPVTPFPSSIALVSSVTVLINVDTLVEEAADTVYNTGLDIRGVIIENVDSSDAEEGRIDRFRSDGCKCQLSGGEPCHTLFTATQILAACDKCHQLTHDQLDMVVMGQLRSSCRNDRVTLKSKANNTVRQRSMTLFHFGGHRICHTFFLFLRAMGTKHFKAIKQSWLESGLCPRIALKILPHNTTKGYQMSNA